MEPDALTSTSVLTVILQSLEPSHSISVGAVGGPLPKSVSKTIHKTFSVACVCSLSVLSSVSLMSTPVPARFLLPTVHGSEPPFSSSIAKNMGVVYVLLKVNVLQSPAVGSSSTDDSMFPSMLSADVLLIAIQPISLFSPDPTDEAAIGPVP